MPIRHQRFKRSYFHRPWSMCLSVAAKSGGPILRGEPKLRNCNGIAVFLPKSQHWFIFRRHSA